MAISAEEKETSAIRGKAGEDAVCDYLEQHGYRILKRNYRAKGGEIDIISLRGEGEQTTICFTEVKTRKYSTNLTAWNPMTTAKKRRIVLTAEQYMSEEKIRGKYWVSYDTSYVTVTTDKFPQVLDINYYTADFTADGLGLFIF